MALAAKGFIVVKDCTDKAASCNLITSITDLEKLCLNMVVVFLVRWTFQSGVRNMCGGWCKVQMMWTMTFKYT